MNDSKKTIWIINHYATTEFNWGSGRPYSISKYLKEDNYNVVVFCASTLHSTGEQYITIEKNKDCKEIIAESGVPFVFIKARSYSGNGKQRVLNIWDFYKGVLKTCKKYAKQNNLKPDIIIGSSAHILDCVAAIKLSKKFKCKSIVEIRDLWPESFIAYGILKPTSIITKVLRNIEKWCYTKSDHILFTMENAYQYIKERGWDNHVPFEKISYINNGIDLDAFEFNKKHFRLDDSDLSNNKTFRVVYTGSIRKVNNVGLLLDAAKLIKEPSIKFLIWGFGDETENLKKKCIDENIKNVIFKGGIEKKYIPYIVSSADLNIMHNLETPIMKYGLSLNKMFDYAASEKPILVDFGKNCNPLINYGAAIVTDNNTKECIAQGIMNAFNLSIEEKKKIRNAARKCAVDYDYKNITLKLIFVIKRLLEESL